jgi:PTH1 family peptidyl-tRNA hydrolase
VRLVASRADERLRVERGLRAEVAVVRRGGGQVALAVPTTYMNESGLAVVALVRRFGISDLGRLVVVHDELDLPPGRVKVKRGGGTAGNNGLRSIHAHLHDPGYVRVRVGIGKPPGRRSGADHVLRRPGAAERAVLDVAVEVAADAVERILSEGVDAAMTTVNADG